jgi:low temperature requirement protein LtrA
MSRGQPIAAISAVVLVLSLFLAWVGSSVDSASLNGWESQNTLDIYLAITAGLVLIGAVMMMSGSKEGFPFAPAAATFLLGVIGTILTVYVLIDVPEGAERKIGIWLATAAIIGVTIGSYLQMREEVAASY